MSSSGLLVAFAFASNDLSMSGKYSFSWLLTIGSKAIKILITIFCISPPFLIKIKISQKEKGYEIFDLYKSTEKIS